MNNNLNGSKFVKFFKNKNVVVALSAILILVILLVAYNVRINSEVKPVYVPVASADIQPRTKITDNLVSLVEVPRAALIGSFYTRKSDVVNKYTKENALIPKGSLFYVSTLVAQEERVDAYLDSVAEGEKLYYLTVNMLTSYTNSILPGQYIDIYISTKRDNMAFVGKLIKDVKVLAVKTSDGKNVFENSDETRVPAVMLFALPEEQHLLLRAVDAINSYAISGADSTYSRIQIIPVPSNTTSSGSEEEIKPTVTGDDIEDYILKLSNIVYEKNSDSNNNKTEDTNENNKTE